MVPVHLASYRERGVLRRFAAAGFPRWSFAIAELVVGLITTWWPARCCWRWPRRFTGCPPCTPRGVSCSRSPSARCAFVGLGVLLGSVLPSARSAQAVGLVLFFPSFLLGAGGPPPHVMGSAVRTVAGPLPLTLLTNAVREPWLGLGTATSSLLAVAALTVACRRGRRPPRGPVTHLVTFRRIRDMSGRSEPGPAVAWPGRLPGGDRRVRRRRRAGGRARPAQSTRLPVPRARCRCCRRTGTAVLLLRAQRPALLLLLYAAAASAGIAIVGDSSSSEPRSGSRCCLIAGWCALTGRSPGRPGVLAAGVVLFTVEWAWIKPDPGWGAWLAGSTVTVLAGLLIRHQLNLVEQLRARRLGWPAKARAEERNRIARDLHDVIAHTLTVSLLHVHERPASRRARSRPTRPAPWPRPSASAGRAWPRSGRS